MNLTVDTTEVEGTYVLTFRGDNEVLDALWNVFVEEGRHPYGMSSGVLVVTIPKKESPISKLMKR